VKNIGSRRSLVGRARPTRWAAIRSVLLVVLLVEVGVTLRYSPALNVRHVYVKGTMLTRPEQIVEKAGFKRDSNWLFLPTSRMVHRLERLPAVADATVSRGRMGTVYIHIFERQPLALLRTSSGSYWVDARGVAFWRTEEASKLPIIRVESPLTVELGRVVQSRSVQAALEVLHRYAPEYQLPVSQIEVDHEGNLCLNMRGRFPPVRIGDSSELPAKLMRVADLWTQSHIIHHAEYLDVSCVSKPVWKPLQKKGAL